MIPDASNPCWQRVLMTEKELAGAVLATKLLVTRLRREVKQRPAALNSKIAELRTYFEKNSFAVKDIALF
ncbi:MAG: hypothetical protein ACX93U_14845 [Salipiger thiooxidans]|jgi:hypothetical protein|uniref:Uncharacterized protein n=1 Tax=Salipiger thiooxidans TaxID=282683 RepID=A0A1G7CQ56_9RHOB|nr:MULTISPECIES: hypothetical protein [Salipiger]EEX12724.1 conserved hypothetical protein [Citreicella sp. SE45]MAU46971.1 hypothetical protein [Salipiger sp.]MBR9837526.1 hypothetical protein [Paracoccaceae bacterium]MBN8185099.1 hypothetical protein [Salipiger thiooxidans]MCA0846402.1 hypothetical protein [Salipiger thiooxidans]|tara:strand:- start:79 stop:288 length:210 start_codon:yes stop_codon:yes gene_type:complete